MISNPVNIYLTHDIDWLNPLHPYAIIKTFLPYRKWLSVEQLRNPNIFLDAIQKMIDLETELNTPGIYLIGATDKNYGRFDLRYNSHAKQYQKLIAILKDQEIGLHSVGNTIEEQAIKLEGITQKPVHFHRSHFLRFNPDKLYAALERQHIQIDFSIGNIRFPTYNQTTSQGNVQIIPTILSDNSFFYHPAFMVINTFRKLLKQSMQENNPISILFHPENTILKPELWKYLREIIHICTNENTKFKTSY